MEPVYYLRVLRRRWQLIAALTILGVVAGLGSYFLAGDDDSGEQLYSSITTLETNVAPSSRGDEAAAQPNLALIQYHASSPEVVERVADRLDVESAELPRPRLVPNTVLSTLEITVLSDHPDRGEEVANAYAEELLAYEDELSVETLDNQIESQIEEVTRLEERYADKESALEQDPEDVLLQTELEQISTQLATANNELEQLESAPPPSTPMRIQGEAISAPISPQEFNQILAEVQNPGNGNRKQNQGTARDAQLRARGEENSGYGPTVRGGVGGVLGFVIAVILVLIIDRLDPRMHTKEDLEEGFDMPVLAEIPALSRTQQRDASVISWERPRSHVTEAFRTLRSAVLFAQVDTEPGSSSENGTDEGDRRARVIMVSSPGPSEGKTTVAANLAAVMAEADLRVLVINCDFRRPRIHQYFQAAYEPRKVQPTQIPGVMIVADVVSDPSDLSPAEVIKAQQHVIRAAADMVDVVLLDTAPILTTNDASELLHLADVVVMVARSGRTTHEAAFRSAELLERRKANAIGSVLVNAEGGPNSGYYYYHRGRYYHDAEMPNRRPDRRGLDDDEVEARTGDGDEVETIPVASASGHDDADARGPDAGD